jgi:hypothetical protein
LFYIDFRPPPAGENLYKKTEVIIPAACGGGDILFFIIQNKG